MESLDSGIWADKEATSHLSYRKENNDVIKRISDQQFLSKNTCCSCTQHPGQNQPRENQHLSTGRARKAVLLNSRSTKKQIHLRSNTNDGHQDPEPGSLLSVQLPRKKYTQHSSFPAPKKPLVPSHQIKSLERYFWLFLWKGQKIYPDNGSWKQDI